MERNTFNLSFICRESKKNKKGLSPVELVININGVRSYLSLSRKQKSSDFRREMSLKRDNETKRFCNAVYTKVQGYVTDLITNNIPVTTVALKKYISSGFSYVYTIGDLHKDFDMILRQRIDVDLSFNVYRAYDFIYSDLIEFIGVDTDVNAITSDTIIKFRLSLERKGYDSNTIASKMTKVKTLFSYGFNTGKIKANPFATIKIKKTVKKVMTISDADFIKIAQKHFSIERLEKVRKLFVLSCHSGISYADLISLTPDDFKTIDGRLCVCKDRVKTRVGFSAVLLPEAEKIVRECNMDLSSLKMSNQKCNSYLGEIKDLCGIKSVESLHFHLARHYYATTLVNCNVPIPIISKCLGHSNVKQTQHYAKLLQGTVVQQVTEAFKKVKI